MKQYLKFKEWTEKKSTQMALNISIIVLIVAVSIVVGISLERNGTLSRILGVSTQAEPTSIPTEIPIPTDNPTPFPTYAPIKTYVDPDPIIDCVFTYIGTMRLKRSVCNKSTECSIGGKWIYYSSVDKCRTDQKADSDKTYKETYDATYKALTNPSTNPNEVTCSSIGYSQERKVWTYILTPEECNSAKANANPTQPTISSYDCTINGQVVGKMTSAECSQKITEYYQAKITPIPDTSVQDYNNAVSACLNRMRALGAASSSQAQACYTNPSLGL